LEIIVLLIAYNLAIVLPKRNGNIEYTEHQ